MRYEEKFNKYLRGELKPEQAEEIENDIEKMQVLLEHMDLESPEADLGANEENVDQEAIFSKQVSGAVRKKFRNYAAAAIIFAIVFVFLFIYALSPLLNRIYYNPDEEKSSKEIGAEEEYIFNEFPTVMAVYMELFCGDKGFAMPTVTAEGYGKYSIDVQTQISGEISHNPLQLTRNHLYEQNPTWNVSGLPYNAFTWRDKKDSHGLGYCGLNKEDAKAKLEELPDSLYIYAAVSFEDTKNAQEILDFMREYEANYLYVPVELNGGAGEYWGFNPYGTGYGRSDSYNHEEYPYLDLNQEDDGKMAVVTADILEQHFRSMIQYMLDNEEFGKIFDSDVPGENVFDKGKYENALAEVKENGIKGYGAVVFAEKEQLLNMLEDSSVDGVYLMDSRLDLD